VGFPDLTALALAPDGGALFAVSGPDDAVYALGVASQRAGGRELTPVRRDAHLSYYEIQAHAARPLEALCRN